MVRVRESNTSAERPTVDVPPFVPAGRILTLPGRGDTFFRHHPARPAVSTGDGTETVDDTSPPVLLLHGWTASADLQWCTLYETLGARHPYVAIDHRGHGRGIRTTEPFTIEDAADDAAALMVALGIGPAIVVGYSMGGPIALTLARRHPAMVSGLVLQATAMVFHDSRRDTMRWSFSGVLETALRSRLATRWGDRGLARAAHSSPQLVPWRGWLAGELRRGDPIALAQAGRALKAFDARSFAGSLGVPAGVLVTTADQLVPHQRQRELADALGADVVELAGDHYAPLFRGADFARATMRLVDSVASPAAASPAQRTATTTSRI